MMRYTLLLLALTGWACTQPVTTSKTAEKSVFFVGTYTQNLGFVDGKASGIYTCTFDPATGAVAIVDSTVGVDNPSFLAYKDGLLLAVGENGGKPQQPYGTVTAYQVKQDKLLKINDMPTYGIAPCHVSIDPLKRFAYVANYVTGNVVSYAITDPTGRLSDSICVRRHTGKSPYAHQVRSDPRDPNLLWAVDKGADGVFAYRVSQNGVLTLQNTLRHAAGDGPRHLDFSTRSAGLMAVVNELSCTVRTYCQGTNGQATVLETGVSTLPPDFKEKNTCADIHFHPTLPVLYASNRGHNSIAVFSVEEATGRLQLLETISTRGDKPRNFTISLDGRWLLAANQDSSDISTYKIDSATGRLTPVGTPARVPTPVCLVWKN
jgi:6-phosphogluconolactonase